MVVQHDFSTLTFLHLPHSFAHSSTLLSVSTRSTWPPSQAELTHCHPVLVASIVVPCYPLSMPVDIKYFVVIAPHILHNLHLGQSWPIVALSWLHPLLYPATPSLHLWTWSTSLSSPHPFCTTSSLTHWHVLVSPNLVICCTCIHITRGMVSGTSPIHLRPRHNTNSKQLSNSNRVLTRCSHMSSYPSSSHFSTSLQGFLSTIGSLTSFCPVLANSLLVPTLPLPSVGTYIEIELACAAHPPS